MKAATLFLGFTGVVLAGMLVLLFQAFGPRSSPPARPEPATQARSVPALRPAEPEPSGVRSVYPGVGTARPAPPPAAEAPHEKPATQAAIAPHEAVPTPARPLAEPEPAEAASGAASGQADLNTVDLNTATLEQLNALGAGMIGRTIIANRPYAAPEDLVSRRVLTRRDYDAIRPQIGVR